jgi:uncharacterized protein YdaT
MLAITLALACENLEKFTGVTRSRWNNALRDKASEIYKASTEDEIEQLIDEHFVNNEEQFMEINTISLNVCHK